MESTSQRIVYETSEDKLKNAEMVQKYNQRSLSQTDYSMSSGQNSSRSTGTDR
uniref:YTH domain-containing protein n=1 Tax=Parascaris univalens TaxID=6257 RepID=A0A914ZGV1_PARUN